MILALNTSTTRFGLALMNEEGGLVAENFISTGEKNFSGFMPALHSLLELTKREAEEIKAIAVAKKIK